MFQTDCSTWGMLSECLLKSLQESCYHLGIASSSFSLCIGHWQWLEFFFFFFFKCVYVCMYVCWWTQGNKERNKTKLEAIHISLKPNRLLVTGSEFLSLLSKVMPAWEIYRQTHTTQSWVMTAIWSVRQTFEWEATEGCGFGALGAVKYAMLDKVKCSK